MFRRPLTALASGKAARTIIRDPRKAKAKKAAVVATNERADLPAQQQRHDVAPDTRPRMAFEPSAQNQQSLGLGSYMLAGVGVAMGVTLVSALFGAIG